MDIMFSLLKLLWLLHNGLTLRYCEGRRSRSQMEVILLTRRVLRGELRGEHPAVPLHRTSTGGSQTSLLRTLQNSCRLLLCLSVLGSLTGIVQSAYGNVFLLTWRFLYWRTAILLAKLRVVPEYPPWNKRPSFKVQQVRKSNHNLEC